MFSSQSHLQTGKPKSILYSPADQPLFKKDGIVLVLNVCILLLLLHYIFPGSAEWLALMKKKSGVIKIENIPLVYNGKL